jgi:hypothetical protein
MRRGSALLNLLLAASLCWSVEAFALKYGPYTGVEGYQEIVLGEDLIYVAFEGSRNTAMPEIEAAWKTRAAQLCLELGAADFIQLHYSFEPVLKTDPPAVPGPHKEAMGSLIRTAGLIYIPIITPHSSGATSVDAPSKQAPVRCVRDSSQALDPERLLAGQAALDDAIKRGWLPPPKKPK